MNLSKSFHSRCIRSFILLPITLPLWLFMGIPLCFLIVAFAEGVPEACRKLVDEYCDSYRLTIQLWQEVLYRATSKDLPEDCKPSTIKPLAPEK